MWPRIRRKIIQNNPELPQMLELADKYVKIVFKLYYRKRDGKIYESETRDMVQRVRQFLF